MLLLVALALAAALRLVAGAWPVRADEALLRECWLRGELPGWDPAAGLGRPLCGATHAGPWYPLNALALVLPLELADAVRLVLALGLAGLGTYLWHAARFGTRAALADACAAQIATACCAQRFGASALDAVLWAPWMLFAIERWNTRHAPLLVAAAATLAVLGGEPIASATALGLALLTALVRERRALPWIALGIVGGAVAWIPLAENRAWSTPPGERAAPVLVGDPEAQLFQRREAPDRLDVEVQSARGGRLVMHEAFHPGWKAAIDGEDADVVRAEGDLRAVDVPAGHVIVRTKFESAALRLGAWISCAALALALVLARTRRLT